MKKVKMPFGESFVELEVPDDASVRESAYMPPLPDPVAAIEDALTHPLGTPPLQEVARGRRSVAIVINDITRPSPSRLMVEAILSQLSGAGIGKEAVTIVIATGNHRAASATEVEEMVGPDVARSVRVVSHDCQDSANMSYFGVTQRGLPVYVNKAVGEAEMRILTGIITPHHCGGYSGGRKSIVPGVAGYETIRVHHSPPIRSLEPVTGIMKGNTFHEEAVAAARLVGVDFILNVIKNGDGAIAGVVAGELEEAHEHGVSICEKGWAISFEHRYDIVVVSPGKYPKDFDLHQAQKAVSAAESVTSEGGIIILVAECRAGVGKFENLLRRASHPQEIIDRFIREGQTKDHLSKAFMCARALVKHPVIVVCKGVSKETLEDMFFEYAPSLEQAFERARRRKGKGARILVLPHAVDCVPVVKTAS